MGDSVDRHSRSAWSKQQDVAGVVADLHRQWGTFEPRAIVVFASHRHDGAALSGALRRSYPQAEVIGCTTAGEFTEAHYGEQGVTALALGPDVVASCAGALARCGDGVSTGVSPALRKLEEGLGVSLRQADPHQYVGIALVEGLRGKEEAINDALGNGAPQLSFVGGSAGDNLDFKQTRVFYNGEETDDGAALLMLKAAVPFHVTKTCSFQSTGKTFRVTRADVPNRVIYELDGRPVTEVYAAAVGTTPDKLDGAVFMTHPMGLVIDGKPWIRSPQRVLPDGGLKFYCQVLEGMEIHLMRSTDLVGDTRNALKVAATELGRPIRGALAFNCILRRLEIDAEKLHQPFYSSFQGLNVAGFHTYGESYLGHINQTLTAVLFA